MSESVATTDPSVEPIVRRAGTGSRWLALSTPDSGLRIGVIGRTETEARLLYREREAAWLAPVEEPVTAP